MSYNQWKCSHTHTHRCTDTQTQMLMPPEILALTVIQGDIHLSHFSFLKIPICISKIKESNNSYLMSTQYIITRSHTSSLRNSYSQSILLLDPSSSSRNTLILQLTTSIRTLRNQKKMCPLWVDRDFVGEGTQPVVGNRPAVEGTAGEDRVPADPGKVPRNLGPRGLGPGVALTLIHQTHRG